MNLKDFIGESSPTRKTAHDHEIASNIDWGGTGMIDHVLQGRTIGGQQNTSVRALTDRGRAANAIRLPIEAGSRVLFAHNVGSVMAYSNIPDQGVGGTVITVRTHSGDVTASEHGVHVLWDDGQYRAVQAEHLRRGPVQKKARLVVQLKSSSMDISEHFVVAGAGEDLIHKATRDLWSFSERDGQFVIERLFSEDGTPLKV